MSRASAAGNGVAKAIEEYASLYRVPWFRMQSRTFLVTGESGKERPMFMGQWTDALGQVHRKGMADYLLMPQIAISIGQDVAPEHLQTLPPTLRDITTITIRKSKLVTVPLWVESKAGTGRLTPDQIDFRDYILSTGAYYLLIENNPEALLEWLKKHNQYTLL